MTCIRSLTSLAFSVSLLLLCISANAAAQGNAELQQLHCVAVDIILTAKSDSLGLVKQDLTQELIVALKAKVPRLKLAEVCPNRLTLRIRVQDISEAASLNAMYGHATLGLERPVIFPQTGAQILVPVWGAGHAYFHGPVGRARPMTIEYLERLVTTFAAQYYEAGNP